MLRLVPVLLSNGLFQGAVQTSMPDRFEAKSILPSGGVRIVYGLGLLTKVYNRPNIGDYILEFGTHKG
jgi:hypothetical protein